MYLNFNNSSRFSCILFSFVQIIRRFWTRCTCAHDGMLETVRIRLKLKKCTFIKNLPRKNSYFTPSWIVYPEPFCNLLRFILSLLAFAKSEISIRTTQCTIFYRSFIYTFFNYRAWSELFLSCIYTGSNKTKHASYFYF